MNKFGVIVIGGHVQGLGITRIYGKNDIPVIVLDKTVYNLARHSKYCKKFYHYKNLLDKLLTLAKTKKYSNWLLMPTHDTEVKIISKNKEKLKKYYMVSSDDWAHVELFFNKRFTYPIVQKLNIPTPKTIFPNSMDEIKNIDISYPCIIKPAIIENFYKKAKTKVFVCNNNNELIYYYKKALSIIPYNEIIIQEIIPGSSENQYSACFLYNKNKSLVRLVAKRKRQHPIDFGSGTTFAETVEKPELINMAEKILQYVAYKGICEVEFKYDYRDNKYKFLEVNPRTWKWHTISQKTKSPFLMSLYNLLYFNETNEKLTWEKAAFKHIITDTPTILQLKLKKMYIKSKVKNIQYAVWDFKDLKPALFELLYLIYFILKR